MLVGCSLMARWLGLSRPRPATCRECLRGAPRLAPLRRRPMSPAPRPRPPTAIALGRWWCSGPLGRPAPSSLSRRCRMPPDVPRSPSPPFACCVCCHFLLRPHDKTLIVQLNNVKVSFSLVTHFVNTSFCKRKKVLTSQPLTGVNKHPSPLTLRHFSEICST